jgi:alpha-tubulin suppressor-like RCC1 family protein
MQRKLGGVCERVRLVLVAFPACFALAGCGGDGSASLADEESEVGQISAELTQVPAGVLCVRIFVSRGQKTTLFNMAAGQSSATLNVGKIALGSTTIEGSAFNVACTSVTTSTVPDWIGNPVNVEIKPGIGPRVTLSLAPNVPSNVGVDFVQPAAALATGLNWSYAIAAHGDVRSWGQNFAAQLGDGTLLDRDTPGPTLLSQVASMAGGAAHACAVTTSGGLKCWGDNTFGQLGDGTNTSRPAPIQIFSSGVAGVSTGHYHTCILTTGGAVQCTGRNDFGQLGRGTTTNATNFVTVGSGYQQVAAGGNHTCGVLLDGSVSCWGSNSSGQLGKGGGSGGFDPNPGGVFWNKRAVEEVRLGEESTCVRRADGTVWCWGSNIEGQLGNGDEIRDDRTTPVQAYVSPGATGLSLGSKSTCALGPFGVQCWGWNFEGEIGDGTSEQRLVPTTVPGLTGAVEVSCGAFHCCARLESGGISCWGHNLYGQLGNGTRATKFTATPAAL